jgi:uncharacterized membrane protein
MNAYLVTSLTITITSLMTRTTPFWKSLQNLDDFVNISMQMEIGNEKRTRFWIDNWQGTILRWEFRVLFTFVQDTNISVVQEPLSQQAL